MDSTDERGRQIHSVGGTRNETQIPYWIYACIVEYNMIENQKMLADKAYCQEKNSLSFT